MKTFNSSLTLGLFFYLISFAQAQPRDVNILMYHKERPFTHKQILPTIKIIKDYLTEKKINLVATEDSTVFHKDTLAKYDAVIFFNTMYRTNVHISKEGEKAFEDYFKGGKGYVGLHAAIPLNTEIEKTIWPWYKDMYGARFIEHIPITTGEMIIEDTSHISTQGVGARITLYDEWYWLEESPRGQVNILATQNGASMTPPWKDIDRPVSWYQEFQGGRSWVTIPGHDTSAFLNPSFMKHVYGGIMYAADVRPGCTDRKYVEYDPKAYMDDGSCKKVVALNMSVVSEWGLKSAGNRSISVSTSESHPYRIEIIDVMGVVVQEFSSQTSAVYRLDGLIPGVYFIHLRSEEVNEALQITVLNY